MSLLGISILGEFVDPNEYFNISEYPHFLMSTSGSVAMTTHPPPLFSQLAPSSVDASPSCPVDAPPTETEVSLVCTEPSEMETGSATAPMVGGASSVVGGATSAFASVQSKDVITPSFYGNPAVGKAVASSTPAAARSLTFTTADRPQPVTGLSTGPGDKGDTCSMQLYYMYIVV